MSKFNPNFWEVSVDPEVLESVLTEPDFLEQIIGIDDTERIFAEEISEEKARAKADALQRIREIVQTKLTSKQRQIVEMYFYEGKTQQTIAQELGINQQVVSKHLFGVLRDGRKVGGAMTKLRKYCEKLGIDPKKWV